MERRVVAHLFRHRTKQMTTAKLVGNVYLEIADHNDSTIGPDALLASTELTRLHVTLENVDAFLRVEGDARHLVEADDVVLCDEPTAPRGVVHEHVGDRRLATRHKMGIWRDLLEQV